MIRQLIPIWGLVTLQLGLHRQKQLLCQPKRLQFLMSAKQPKGV